MVLLRILPAVLLLLCLASTTGAAGTVEPLPEQVAVNDLDDAVAYIQPRGVVTAAPEGPTANALEDLEGLNITRPTRGAHLEIDPDDLASASYLAELADGIHSSSRTGLKIGGWTVLGSLGALVVPLPPVKVLGAVGLVGGGVTVVASGLGEIGGWGLDFAAAVKAVYADRKIVYDE